MDAGTGDTITIRAANPTDGPQVTEIDALATAALRKVYRPREESKRQSQRYHHTSTRLVAVLEDRVVGTVKCRREGERVHLFRLSVHPSYRRQGIATALLESVEAIAKILNARCLSLHTVKESGNVTFFERRGFSVIREEVDSDSESERHDTLIDVYMEKASHGA